MLIQWNGLGPLGLTKPAPKVNGKKGEVMAAGAVVALMPGINKIEDKDWDTFKDNPQIVAFIKGNKLEVKSEKVATANQKKEKGGSVDLAAFDSADAVEIVKSTYDLKLLNVWDSEDGRRPVQKAIADQIAMMNKPAEKSA